MCNEQKPFVYENLKFLLRKLITSNVGSSPDTSLGAYGPRDVSGEEPTFEVINSYIYLIKSIFTNRTSIDVKPGLISSKQTWIDVNGLWEQKIFTQTWYYKGVA